MEVSQAGKDIGTCLQWERILAKAGTGGGHTSHVHMRACTHWFPPPPQRTLPSSTDSEPTKPHSVSLELYRGSSWKVASPPASLTSLSTWLPLPPTVPARPRPSRSPLGGGCGDMAQCVPCKHNDVSLIPRVIKLEVVVCACNCRAGEAERWIPGACW